MTDTITEFEVGGVYETRSPGDHECVWQFTVTGRTSQFVTIVADGEKPRRVGVKVWDGAEFVLPLGNYSMCPVLRAERRCSQRS